MRLAPALAATAVLVLGLAVAPRARADQLADFQAARAAYEAHDFTRAVALFEDLVGGPTPRLDSEALVLESRKYLGAAYVFLGRPHAAETQFELLLTADPTYELDPASFPIEVVELFAGVRDDLAERARLEEERAADAARRAYERERIRALVEFAEEEVEVEIENSRWVAALPFGVGQFQNGDDGLGAFFLAGESLATLTLAGTLAGFLRVAAEVDASPSSSFVVTGEADRVALGLSVANWVSAGILAVLLVTGIAQAQLDFRPTRTVRHRRVVPPELLEAVELSVGPGDAALRIAF